MWAMKYSLQLLILVLEPDNKIEIRGEYSKMSQKIHKGLKTMIFNSQIILEYT